jgi:hypothetical protein
MRKAWLLVLVLFPNALFAQSWRAIAPMMQARLEARCIELNNGKILIAGGRDDFNALTECELYDPMTDTWQKAGQMETPRYRYEMQPLPGGKILVCGGLIDLGSAATATAEIYDPETDVWTSASNMNYVRQNHASVVLPDSTIMVLGGIGDGGILNTCEIYDPVKNDWRELPTMPVGCYGIAPYYCQVLNKLFACSGVVGGFGGNYTKNVQVYDFATQTWTAGSPLTEGHVDCEKQSVVTEDGSYILFGGRAQPNVTTGRIEAFDLPTQTWKTLGSLIVPHWHAFAFPVGADSFLVVGGVRDPAAHAQSIDTTTWFNFQNRTSFQGPRMIDSRFFFSGLLLRTPTRENPCLDVATIYVFGGATTGDQPMNRCERLDLGLRQKPSNVSVSPVSLSLSAASCSGRFDTLISYSVKDCVPVVLDSFVSYNSSVIISSRLPDTIHANETHTLSVTIHTDGKSQSVPAKLVFSTKAGKVERYIYFELQTGTVKHSFASVNKLSLSGTICAPSSASLSIQNPSCDTVTIDSVVFAGADAKLFGSETSQSKILPFDSASVSVMITSDQAGTYSGSAIVYCHAGSRRDTLRATLSATLSGKTVPSAHVIIKDAAPVRPGEEVVVPVLLSGGASALAEGYRLHLRYNTDLLRLEDAIFEGTLSSGAGGVSDINITSDGAELYVPSGITLNTGTLVKLVFKTYLTLADCSALDASSLIFSPDDPQFSTCILSTNMDSARICIQTICGGNEMRDLMATREVKIVSIEQSGNILTARFSEGSEDARGEVYDMMGRPVAQMRQDESAALMADVHQLSSGVYFLRSTIRNQTHCRIFALRSAP